MQQLMGSIEPREFSRTSTCGKHGEYREKGGSITGREDRIRWFGCGECNRVARELERRAAQVAEEQEKQRRIEQRLKQAGIPMAFRGRSFENFVAETPEQKHAKRIASEFAENFWAKHMPAGDFLVFGGSPGTGKSHLALAIAQDVMKRGTAMYLDAMELIRLVRATWDREADRSEADVINTLASLNLLIIDEIGVQNGTESEQMILFDVVNRRYRDLRPTILLTNLSGKALGSFVGPRVMDRLMERSVFVAFKWESFRGRSAA